jgi:hypothetical protein
MQREEGSISNENPIKITWNAKDAIETMQSKNQNFQVVQIKSYNNVEMQTPFWQSLSTNPDTLTQIL